MGAYRAAIDLGADSSSPTSSSAGTAPSSFATRASSPVHRRRRPPRVRRPAAPRSSSTEAPRTGWFTEDFTLAELRTLRAVERMPGLRPHNSVYDGRFGILTLGEVIELARSRSTVDRRSGCSRSSSRRVAASTTCRWAS